MERSLLVMTTLVYCLLLIAPTRALATVYECKATQALRWYKGRLVPYSNESGDIVTYYDMNEGLFANKISVATSVDGPCDFFNQTLLRDDGLSHVNIMTTAEIRVGGRFRRLQTFHLKSLTTDAKNLVFLYNTDILVVSGSCRKNR